MSLLRRLIFSGTVLSLSVLPIQAHAAESAAQKALKTRTIEPCGLDCGTLSLVSGRETVFHLNLQANAGANGISIGDPKVVASTLIKIGSESGKVAPDKYELVLKALSEGKSSITIRTLNGETAAHFDVVVRK